MDLNELDTIELKINRIITANDRGKHFVTNK